MFSDVGSRSERYGAGSGAEQTARKVVFWVFAVLATVLALFTIFPLVLVWVLVDIKHTGLEVDWTGSEKTFNWHPTLSVFGLMVVMTHSMLVYRIYSRLGCTAKIIQKSVHVFLMVVVMILLSLAYGAVVKYHHTQGFSNVISMHSWLGVTTGIFFFLQFLFGLCFVFPIPVWIRKIVMPYHRAMGFGTLIIAAATMLSGIQEQMGYDDPLGRPTVESHFAQSLGLVIVLLTLVVGFLLSRPEFARFQPEHHELQETGEKVPLRPAY